MSEPSGSYFDGDTEPSIDSGNERVGNAADGKQSIPTIKPLEFAFTGNAEPEPKRRGRPPGTKNRTGSGATATGTETKTPVPNLASTIENAIWTLSVFASRNLEAPELSLSKQQAADIQEATLNVAKFYNHTPDPKMVAWFNLATVLGFTFYPKIIAVRDRKRQEKKNTPKVVQMSPQQAANSAKTNGAAAPQTAKPTIGAKPISEYSPSELFGFEPPTGGENEG